MQNDSRFLKAWLQVPVMQAVQLKCEKQCCFSKVACEIVGVLSSSWDSTGLAAQSWPCLV